MSRRAGVMVQSNEMYFDAMAPDMSGLANIDMQAVAGSQAEDLYYYHLKDVTLAKDERGYFPLLSLEVPYEHIYTWDIADTLNPNRYNPYQQQQQETPQVVWHSLKLTNTGDQPWTTAPAMTVQHGQVLGQDMIKFTAPTAETKLRITQAVSIAADHNEYEIDRQRNAQIYGSRQHDLVTVRGELSLINRKAEAVTVEITKLITGTVEETQGDPKIEKLAHGLRAVNPQARLTWKIEVQPGNDNVQTLTYTYKVYVPN